MRARTAPEAGEPITSSHPTALAHRMPLASRLPRSAIYICSPPRLCPIPSAAAAGHIGALLDIGATHGVDLGLYRHVFLKLRPGACCLCQSDLAEREATSRRAIPHTLSCASATTWPAPGGVCSVSLILHRCGMCGSRLRLGALHPCDRATAANAGADAVEVVVR